MLLICHLDGGLIQDKCAGLASWQLALVCPRRTRERLVGAFCTWLSVHQEASQVSWPLVQSYWQGEDLLQPVVRAEDRKSCFQKNGKVRPLRFPVGHEGCPLHCVSLWLTTLQSDLSWHRNDPVKLLANDSVCVAPAFQMLMQFL